MVNPQKFNAKINEPKTKQKYNTTYDEIMKKHNITGKFEDLSEEKQDTIKKIKDLYDRLDNTKGTKTEVWSRVVGFFRPISDWNKGKTEEFGDRITYDV